MEAGERSNPGGRTLVSTRGTSIIGLGAVVLIIGLVILTFGVNGSGAFLAIGLIVAIVGGLGLGFGIREVGRWEPLELRIPEWPLPMGAAIPAQLVRQSKRAVPDRPVQVTGELLCIETVRYQQGTDTRTDRETVCRIPIQAEGEISNGVFSAALPLFIPLSQGGPTLDLAHNEIEWRVELDFAEFSRLMRDVTFRVTVGGRVRTENQRGGIQDAPRSAP